MTPTLDIVGAGPAGLTLALLLAQRGHRVRVFERRSDPRAQLAEGGRSINLALAARGMRALQAAGALEALRPHCVPMPGRMLHVEATPQFIPYGQREHEIIYSISRSLLHRQLTVHAAAQPGITLHFGQRCIGLQWGGDAHELQLRDEHSGTQRNVTSAFTIGADGAGSALRAALVAQGSVRVREERLAHGYQEFSVPHRAGSYAMEANALHIWPRGNFMLIALPNTDCSFTATLFLPEQGPVSFASLEAAAGGEGNAMRAFFEREFADVAALMPHLEREALAHPRSALGTVYCEPWQVSGVVLLGDAAHAIVPFHGQGMNCALEDCLLLDRLIGNAQDLPAACREFEAQRRADTDAIAQMALENYLEMRDSVREPRWQKQKSLALQLERRFPTRFIPRYSMVMFHSEIGYADALRRGTVQQQILDELLDHPNGAESDGAQADGAQAEGELAARLVTQRLTPLPAPAS